MTDRELLESIQAQIDAHIAPRDCVLGDEVIVGEAVLEECQPDGSQRVEVKWTRPILVEPANGGAACGPTSGTRIESRACIYVPPPVDCVLGAEEIVSETPLEPCQPDGTQSVGVSWVRRILVEPMHGGKVCDPTSGTRIERRPCVYVTPRPEDEWPADWTALPKAGAVGDDGVMPPPGWLSGDGYRERRNFIEAQWHDAGHGDLDRARHMHIAAAIPDVCRGVIRLDVRLLAFHWEASSAIVKSIQAGFDGGVVGAKVMLPAPYPASPGLFNWPITRHLHEFYVPVLIDTRGIGHRAPDGTTVLSDGQKLLRLNFSIRRNADGVHHLISMFIPLLVENGEGRVVKDGGSVGLFSAAGWMTEFVSLYVDPELTTPLLDARGKQRTVEVNVFSYLNAHALNWDPAVKSDAARRLRRFVDDPMMHWNFRADTGSTKYPITLQVMRNPDLHAHPPRDGDALVGTMPITSGSTLVTVAQPPGMVEGDRIVVRAADTKSPSTRGQPYVSNGVVVGYMGDLIDPNGAAATLLVIKLGKART